MGYKEKAIVAYANDDERKMNKAIAAGTAIDNALEKEYSKGGHTHCHFMMDNYLAYFSYDALGKERMKLILNNWSNG